MLIKSKILLVVIFIVTLISCEKSRGLGSDSEIYILADKGLYELYKNQLDSIFNDLIFTPTEEPRYFMENINKASFKGKMKYKKLILLADVDSDTEESKFILSLFKDSSKVAKGVREKQFFYSNLENVWSKDQQILILLDSHKFFLDNFLYNNDEILLNIFKNHDLQNIKKYLLKEDYLNKKAMESAYKRFKVKLKVPHDYILSDNKHNPEYIRFRRLGPYRWLTLMKEKYNPNWTMKKNIIELRDRAGKLFYDSVRVNPAIFSIQKDTTFHYDGFKAKGIWEYKMGGGPFFCYAFVEDGILYLIDGAVFAPGKDKYPYINQLDLFAKTVEF